MLGHDDLFAALHSVQVSAEVVLEVAHADLVTCSDFHRRIVATFIVGGHGPHSSGPSMRSPLCEIASLLP